MLYDLGITFLTLGVLLIIGALADHYERRRPHPARDLREVYKDEAPRGAERLRRMRGER